MMHQYNEFHGNTPIDMIGKRLREIAKKETAFKIVTGYGSTSGIQKSKQAALRSLSKMAREGVIAAYLPGEKAYELSRNAGDIYYKARTQFDSLLRRDGDRGNEGVIYVFVKESLAG